MPTVEERIRQSIAVKETILADSELVGALGALGSQCGQSLLNGGKIIFAGNGGSFADSQHLAAEFVSRFMIEREPLASVALGTNSSAMSAIGNDYGFDQVFTRELKAIGSPNDVFIAISTSGNSANILMAVDAATEIGIHTVGWTGANGGKLLNACECIRVPSSDTARIQESHIMFGHVICEIAESIVTNQ